VLVALSTALAKPIHTPGRSHNRSMSVSTEAATWIGELEELEQGLGQDQEQGQGQGQDQEQGHFWGSVLPLQEPLAVLDNPWEGMTADLEPEPKGKGKGKSKDKDKGYDKGKGKDKGKAKEGYDKGKGKDKGKAKGKCAGCTAMAAELASLRAQVTELRAQVACLTVLMRDSTFDESDLMRDSLPFDG
jgi:hypothetical protein